MRQGYSRLFRNFGWDRLQRSDAFGDPSTLNRPPDRAYVVLNDPNRVDIGLCLCFAVLGGLMAWFAAHEAGWMFFYQMYTPEALMWACGRGAVLPQRLTPDMVDFLLHLSAPVFDCSKIPADIPTGPPGFFFNVQLYTSWIAALLWRWRGPTQAALLPMAAAFGALYASGAFLLARTLLPRIAAVMAGLVVACSPVMLSHVPSLRDFSKGGLLLWTIALVVLAGRQPAQGKGGGAALFAGVVCGVGFGFRPDVWIMMPLGCLYLAVAVPGWRRRCSRLALFVAGFMIASAPLPGLNSNARGGSFVIQGATEPFRAFANLRPAPYTLGHAYLDELTLSGIAAAERPRRPNWDALEPGPHYQLSQSLEYSTANLLEWAPNFAADFAAQALKGAAWIVGYPALVAAVRGPLSPGSATRLDLPVTRWQEGFYAFFGHPWMPALGFSGLMAMLWLVAARNGREAWALAGLLTVLVTYPAIQYSIRHFFYLEFLWPVELLSLPLAVLHRRRLMLVARPFALWSVLVLTTIGVSYFILTLWQQNALQREFTALLAQPREPIIVEKIPESDGGMLLRVPLTADDAEMVAAAPDSMTDRIAEIAVQWDVRATGHRMLFTLGGADCPAGPVLVGLRYKHQPNVWQKLDSTILAEPGASMVFPALYRGTQHFDGLVLPASHISCTVQVFRLPLTYGLPLILTAVLPPDWEHLPLRKGLGNFRLKPPQ